MSTRCQVKVWINEDNVLSYYHHSGGWPSNMVFDLMGIAHGVKLDFTKEFVDPREKKMQEIRRVLFSLLPKENSNEEQEEC